jgi:hypothetical protein
MVVLESRDSFTKWLHFLKYLPIRMPTQEYEATVESHVSRMMRLDSI